MQCSKLHSLKVLNWNPFSIRLVIPSLVRPGSFSRQGDACLIPCQGCSTRINRKTIRKIPVLNSASPWIFPTYEKSWPSFKSEALTRPASTQGPNQGQTGPWLNWIWAGIDESGPAVRFLLNWMFPRAKAIQKNSNYQTGFQPWLNSLLALFDPNQGHG